MSQFTPLAKGLILIGSILILIGVIIQFGGKFFPFGRLPGDIVIRGEKSTFYFPIVTCLVVSIVLSLLSYLFKR